MTLIQLIRAMELVALRQPAVKCVVENDVFRLNSLPNAKYGVFAWLPGEHREDTETSLRTYSFTLFYVDRLRTDEKNQIEVQSVGVETLRNILRSLEENWGVEVGRYSIRTFNQRFIDVCAGAFANVQITAPVDTLCPDASMGDFNNDFNDDFWTFIL